ncbi:hypothetical protein O181_003878 [Austropuccinia psidii MF-1]|uniref:Uncharacterized protein n=1 Tax=Austropuccinia psidii MF-1 TaxID=1389203 RepID=A0A9Q3BF92_9BASI|nr:hypothetical protein [Austropuccinia psidii MF-1]
MSPVHLINLRVPMNESEDREELVRATGPGFGHYGGWQDTQGNSTHTAIHLPVQQTPLTRGLDRNGSSFSAPQTPERAFPMENGKKEVQPG